jgi:hypothetical protein
LKRQVAFGNDRFNLSDCSAIAAENTANAALTPKLHVDVVIAGLTIKRGAMASVRYGFSLDRPPHGAA